MRAHASALLFSLLAAFSACGGATSRAAGAAASPSGAASASSSPASPSTALAPANVTLPAERPIPPVTLGSKLAKVRGARADDALGEPAEPGCITKAQPTSLAALAKACTPNGNGKASPAASVSLADAQPAASLPLAAERGACYRFLAIAEGSLEGLVLVVMDSKGAVAVEARTPGKALFAPTEGPLCFESADAGKILLSAGRGAGRAQLQVVREP